MLIKFLILGLGLIFVNRTIKFQINRKPLSEAILIGFSKKQILFYLILTILSTCFHPSIILLIIISTLFLIFYIDWVTLIILRQNFQQLWVQFLDELILIMMTGRSFRDSFLFITEKSQGFFHLKLREILFKNDFNKIQFTLYENTNKLEKKFFPDSNLTMIYEMVQSIDKNPHKAIERLKTHRHQVRWALRFKKKSYQITFLIKTQAFVLSLLYFGLFFFVIMNGKNNQQELKDQLILYEVSTIILSFSLYCVGVLLFFILGKRRPWKT